MKLFRALNDLAAILLCRPKSYCHQILVFSRQVRAIVLTQLAKSEIRRKQNPKYEISGVVLGERQSASIVALMLVKRMGMQASSDWESFGRVIPVWTQHKAHR